MLQLLACRDIRAEREKYHVDSIVYTRLLELNSRHARQLGHYVQSAKIDFSPGNSKQIALDCIDTVLYFFRKLETLPFSNAHSVLLDSLYCSFQSALQSILSELEHENIYIYRNIQTNLFRLKNNWADVEFFKVDQTTQSAIFYDWLETVVQLIAESASTKCSFEKRHIQVLAQNGKDSLWVALMSEHPTEGWAYVIAPEMPLNQVMTSPWSVEHIQKIAVSDTSKGLFLYHLGRGAAFGMEKIPFEK